MKGGGEGTRSALTESPVSLEHATISNANGSDGCPAAERCAGVRV